MSQAELGLALLPLASKFAIAPISNFYVGAVAFDSQGNAYLGANFEFAHTHIGQTIHAEQSAIANAWYHGATDLDLLVINYPPCGHCRQFINEVRLSDQCKIQLPHNQAKPFNYYLPEDFSGNDLGVTQRLFDTVVKSNNLDTNDCLEMAKFAYKRSHAPYTGDKSGIALQYDDGEIVIGSYAENCAFNPSLPALQSALNQRRLQGKDWKNINKAIMLENTTSLSQYNNACDVLQHICSVELELVNV